MALSDEKRLIKHLLDNYDRVGKVGRPVFNTTQTMNVQYGLALIQILDLDEKNQVLTTNCWSRYVSERRGGLEHNRAEWHTGRRYKGTQRQSMGR